MLDSDKLNHRLLQIGSPFGGKVVWHDSVTSTSDVINEVQDYHGAVCLAGAQTAGRGTRGRQWHAPAGSSVLMSIGWQVNPETAAGLSLACGLAVIDALFRTGIAGAKLKWPNDVLIGNQKIAGILLELSASKCVIGIGLNVNISDSVQADDSGDDQSTISVPSRVGLSWGDLHQHGYKPRFESLAAALLESLGTRLREFDRKGFGPLVEQWNQAHAFHGKPVSLFGVENVTGVVAGVASDGALMLDTPTGLKSFYSGEVSMRPVRQSVTVTPD